MVTIKSFVFEKNERDKKLPNANTIQDFARKKSEAAYPHHYIPFPFNGVSNDH